MGSIYAIDRTCSVQEDVHLCSSINQSGKQSCNQSITQSINQSIKISFNQSAYHSMTQLINQFIDPFLYPSIQPSIHPSIHHPSIMDWRSASSPRRLTCAHGALWREKSGAEMKRRRRKNKREHQNQHSNQEAMMNSACHTKKTRREK